MRQDVGMRLTSALGVIMAAAMLTGAGQGLVFYSSPTSGTGTGSRYGSVSTRTSTFYLNGYAENLAEPVCIYQQKSDSTMVVLACVYPTSVMPNVDACGVTWYYFSASLTLNANDAYWFGQHNPAAGKYENAQLFVTRNTSNSGLYTGTDDWQGGPSKWGPTCWRSVFNTNASVSPITVFRGGEPSDLNCAGASRSYAGCPFLCNLPSGCDSMNGARQAEFTQASYRLNSSLQDTSQTQWELRGLSSTSGTVTGAWVYGPETGQCMGGTNHNGACTQNAECPGGGYCNTIYQVMRRDVLNAWVSNIKRGETWRNVRIEAYAKNHTTGTQYRDLGLIGRYYNADNYFLFKVTEYGGDAAGLYRVMNGTMLILTPTTFPALTLVNNWTRLGFDIQDNGSYVNAGFVPNGTCALTGRVGGASVVSVASTDCSFAPVGSNGIYHYYNRGAQFFDLDATPLGPVVF